MSARQGLVQRFDDWLNPIVVKELRQAVQSKFVAAVLLVLLVIQLAALAIYIISGGDFSNRWDAGRDAFMILYAILVAICLIFVPTYTGFRLAFERSDTNVDLLFITTIRPLAIIGGKIFAALTITVLIFSACMPFMVFTYWLRGIDLPSIFVLLTISFLVVVATVHIATFVACISAGRVLKLLLGLAALALLLPIFILTLSSSFGLLSSGVGSRLGTTDFWGEASAVLAIGLATIGILFVLSVALLTPSSANRAFPVRLFLTCLWAVTGVASVIISVIQKDTEPVRVWSILGIIVFSIAFFVAVGEREQLGRRVASKIPTTSGLRFAAFFFFSGAAGGVAWACLMCILTIAFSFYFERTVPGGYKPTSNEMDTWVAGLALYGFSYSMTGLLLRRKLVARWIDRKYTWVIAVVLLVVGCIVPFLVGYLVFLGNPRQIEDIGPWLVGNPFVLGIDKYQVTYVTFAGIWAVFALVPNVPWFIAQIEEFRPLDLKEKASLE